MKMEFSSQSRKENLAARLRNGFVLDQNMATTCKCVNQQYCRETRHLLVRLGFFSASYPWADRKRRFKRVGVRGLLPTCSSITTVADIYITSTLYPTIHKPWYISLGLLNAKGMVSSMSAVQHRIDYNHTQVICDVIAGAWGKKF